MTILSLKFTQSVNHCLRAICVVTFPVGFVFLLISGILSHRVNPALGSLPLFLSALFSSVVLHNERSCSCRNSGLMGTPLHLMFDLFLGLGLLICLVFTWVFLPRAYHRGHIMLGTYASVFLMVNFTIHLYFSLAQLSESFVELVYPSSCTQCQYGNFSSNRLGKNKGYMPVQHSEETQQLYTDDQLTTGRSSLGDCPPRPSHEVA